VAGGIVRRPAWGAWFLVAAAAGASAAPRAPQQAPAREQRSVVHLLDQVPGAKIGSILLASEPLGTMRLDLDQAAPERVHDDGRVRLWRLDLPLTRGPDGRPVAPTLARKDGGALPPEVKPEILASRTEVLFKDHPDFKDHQRASDVHGNRYIVLNEEGAELVFKVPLPDFACRLGLAVKVLGTRDDFESVGKPPRYTVTAGGKELGTFDGSSKLDEKLFDLPASASGEVEVKVRVSDVTPQKGGLPMVRSFALVASDGCDRLVVRAPEPTPGLVADYPIAAPPPVQVLFDYGLAHEERKEWSGEATLLPGAAAVVADMNQEWELLVDGQSLGKVRGRGQDEIRFESSRLGRARIELRAKGSLRGTFHLVQPRAIFSKLRDPMESLRDPTPFVRGLESAGTHPLVRHVMSKDETHLALLAPAPTTVELEVELREGDRFECAMAAMPLVDEKLRHPIVTGRVVFTRAGGAPLVLAELELNRKRRLEWEARVATIAAEQAGRGTLRFESGCGATTPLSAFEALFAFGDPVIVRAAAPATPRKPNVLVYLIDTLRADHTTTGGYSRDTTPNLKRMADEGITFERAYSQAPWTRPSVATLFSSYLHTFHNASKMTGLAPEIETLAERFRAAGYATGAFLANAHVHGASLNFEQGFSHFEAIEKARQRGDSRANQVQESALAWLDAQQDRPFFLYVHTIDPHAPYDPPESTKGVWSGSYDGRVTPKRTNARELTDGAPWPEPDLKHVVDLYDEEILFNDREFGALCESLRERGLWDDTIVLVVSDHGEEFQDHGGFGHGTVMWNELIHVPLVVKLDKRDSDPPPGRRVAERVRVMDVPQTLLQRAGVAAPPAEFMGFDLAPAFTADGELPELPVIAEEFPDRKCLISGDLKWIWYGPKCRRQRTWLFHLGDDPLEQHDLSEERPEVVRRMREELERLYADWEARGFKHHQMVQERLSGADLEALGQLGYIDAGGEEEDDGNAPPPDRDAKREERREEKREGKRRGDGK